MFIIIKTFQFFYAIHIEGQIQIINGLLITLFIYSALELKKVIKTDVFSRKVSNPE